MVSRVSGDGHLEYLDFGLSYGSHHSKFNIVGLIITFNWDLSWRNLLNVVQLP